MLGSSVRSLLGCGDKFRNAPIQKAQGTIVGKKRENDVITTPDGPTAVSRYYVRVEYKLDADQLGRSWLRIEENEYDVLQIGDKIGVKYRVTRNNRGEVQDFRVEGRTE